MAPAVGGLFRGRPARVVCVRVRWGARGSWDLWAEGGRMTVGEKVHRAWAVGV